MINQSSIDSKDEQQQLESCKFLKQNSDLEPTKSSPVKQNQLIVIDQNKDDDDDDEDGELNVQMFFLSAGIRVNNRSRLQMRR